MTIQAVDSNCHIDPVLQAKTDLAAALRLAVLHELEEGIDNHFTMTVPGYDDRYFILPFRLHWSEARARDMIIFNEQGQTLEGNGLVERSAYCIHAPIHRISGAKVVLHTHQTWTVSLNMLQDNYLMPACQTSALLVNLIAYDNEYRGIADTAEEGEILAGVLGEKSVLFMKNHGVLVAADTMAKAYRLLYLLERVCRMQILAMSTGKQIQPISAEVLSRLQTPKPGDQYANQRHHLFFEAMKRVLDKENPGYQE